MIDLLTNVGAVFKARIRRAARRQMASALLGGLALVFAGVSVVATVVAIGVALAARWGVLAACLIIAAAAFLVAILLVFVAVQQAKEARRRQQAELAQLRQTMLAAKAIAADMTRGKALIVVAVLGLLVGLTAAKHEPQDKA
ncbi:phage holin family protein [Tabrizicola sp.]|uniref:phage holin family protein n=1 Tax=Tabrizicola sp. TaxID=2005166 RepID=UPI00286A87AD|nr:phage holin family protein [Tabrizicola sp.]